ncbi:hypothetical protein ACSFE6_00265 [Pseudomonas baetica]|uniref:hypothetical protein n=1 Tax=Pseudomonas baetica TaxID=674054 RepID=UPI003EEE0394
MNTQQTESIDAIGTAETVEQAHKDARYATSYLQALYDARFITEAEYDHQVEAIKATFALQLSQLRAALLSRQSVGVSPESIRFRAAIAHLDSRPPYTDGAEYELIKLLFLDTPVILTAVGDTKQTIMGWVGVLDGIFKT